MADLKLELVLLPVSDVDRAKAFYTEQLGFDLDVDHQPNDEFRVVGREYYWSCRTSLGQSAETAKQLG